jgi:hypothetical protein
VAKASLLEAAINGHDAKEMSKLLSELRQQTFYHLLFRDGGDWKERKRIDRHGNYIYIERPTNQQGNFNVIRSTREISGDAEEVYRDLLTGDIDDNSIQGRRRWEKRFSREEVLDEVNGISNEERVPYIRNLFKNTKQVDGDDSSVILKEWRKLGGMYKGGHTYSGIPSGVRIIHRYMKSVSGFASCRDLVLLQVKVERNSVTNRIIFALKKVAI